MWQKVETFKGAEYFRKALYLLKQDDMHGRRHTGHVVALCLALFWPNGEGTYSFRYHAL